MKPQNRFELTMKTDNAAFADNDIAEVARILREVADKLDAGTEGGNCVDFNGNTVGGFELEQDDERAGYTDD